MCTMWMIIYIVEYKLFDLKEGGRTALCQATAGEGLVYTAPPCVGLVLGLIPHEGMGNLVKLTSHCVHDGIWLQCDMMC